MWFSKFQIDFEKMDKAEKELGIQLPEFFRRFYQEQSALIKKFKNLNRDEDYITLTTDFDWMLEFNRDFLQLPKSEGLCAGKICIGTDGCGNDSFISLSGDDERVFKIDHEIGQELFDENTGDMNWEDERMEKYASLEQYLKDQIKFLREFRN